MVLAIPRSPDGSKEKRDILSTYDKKVIPMLDKESS